MMKHVLFVDDDPIMREMAAKQLSRPETSITLADSAEAALKVFTSHYYDLIITDVDMAGVTGLEMVRRMQAYAPERKLQFIVISGRKDLETIDRTHQLGGAVFISKPVNWRLLPFKVSDLLFSGEK